MKIPFLEKRKFILIIGDDGAVLSYFDKNKVEKRLFALSASLTDRRELNSILTKYPSVPIYVLLDTMEQSYTKQTLPAVGSLAIGKLVKKRLERDFAESDIKGAVLFGRDSEGRKDWIYMFAAAPVTRSMSDWFEYISSLENKFAGIYMLPVEMQNFVASLNKSSLKSKNDKPAWQFVITHNKTGGFRQVILHNDKVVFTRLIRPGKDNLPDIIAGNIEQEVLNTIDYLRRLSFGDDDQIDITVIVSKEIKKSLEETKIRGKAIAAFTPYEVASAMKMSSIVGPDDKFSDIVFCANFIKAKPVLRLENPKMKEVNTLLTLYTLSTSTILIAVPFLTLYSAYLGLSIFNINNKITDAENEKARIEKEWRDARENDEYNIDDANKITDFATLHEMLKDKESPLELINKVSVAQKDQARTSYFSWNLQAKSGNNKGTKTKELILADVDMNFYNSGDNIEELFSNYDSFSKKISSTLSDYKVEVSELPDKVSFENNRELINVKVKISSKQDDKR